MGAAALSDVAVQLVPAPAAVEGAVTDPAHVGAALLLRTDGSDDGKEEADCFAGHCFDLCSCVIGR